MREFTDSTCKICGLTNLDAEAKPHGVFAKLVVKCPRCGPYEITELAEAVVPSQAISDKMHLLSGAIRHFYENGFDPFNRLF